MIELPCFSCFCNHLNPSFLTVCNYLVNTLYHEIMYLQVITVTRNASLLNKFQPRVHLHLPYKQHRVVYLNLLKYLPWFCCKVLNKE